MMLLFLLFGSPSAMLSLAAPPCKGSGSVDRNTDGDQVYADLLQDTARRPKALSIQSQHSARSIAV